CASSHPHSSIFHVASTLQIYTLSLHDALPIFAFHSKDNMGKAIDIYRYAGKESIIKECEDSLRRLGTDYIDLYQIHWPDSTTPIDRKSTRLNSSHVKISYAVFCLKKKNKTYQV